MTSPLDELCEELKIERTYWDGAGHQTTAPAETCYAILQGLGFNVANGEDCATKLAELEAINAKRRLPRTLIVQPETTETIQVGADVNVPAKIKSVDGELHLKVTDGILHLPPLPLGMHRLVIADQNSNVISAPPQLPAAPRAWGVTAPLYGLRGSRPHPIGTYTELQDLAVLVGQRGGSFLGVNPAHAIAWNDPDSISPYGPTSRQWLNPLHVTPRADTALSDEELIDYPSATSELHAAFSAEFAQWQSSDTPEHEVFEAFLDRYGPSLKLFAIHQALADRFGPHWNKWPAEFQIPSSDAVQNFANSEPNAWRFHAYLQWRAEVQLIDVQKHARGTGMAFGLYLDLAVGTHPFGADTWQNPSAYASGVSLGAPPDAFSANGQNWNIAPFNPFELEEQAFKPLIDILEKQLAVSGLLRIDHILGFERAFFVPEGLPGAYVRFPIDELLAVVRMVAAKSDATIIGEDLGNVPDGLRDRSAASGILGYNVAMFERDWNGDKRFLAPDEYRELALASFSTHDLPTIRGWIQSQDINWRERIGELALETAADQRSERNADIDAFRQAIGSNNTEPDMLEIHEFLAKSRSNLVAVQIEDILEITEQSNLPGTVESHPNWRRRLPKSVAEIAKLPLLSDIANIMNNHDRGPKKKEATS